MVDVSGFEMRIDASYLNELEQPIDEFLNDIGDSVLANAKRLAPEETTALNRSLEKTTLVDGGDKIVRVGVRAGFTYADRHPEDYAKYVERTQPFLKPALYQARIR